MGSWTSAQRKQLTGPAADRTLNGDEESRARDILAACGGWVRVERRVRQRVMNRMELYAQLVEELVDGTRFEKPGNYASLQKEDCHTKQEPLSPIPT